MANETESIESRRSDPPERVTVLCAACSPKPMQFLGHVNNSWTQVSSRYFAHGDLSSADAPAAANKLALNPSGQQPARGTNKAFEGCLVQLLACPQCSADLAFQCIEVPFNKAHYKDRIFYKVEKLHLSNSKREPVEPVVVESLSRESALSDSPLSKRPQSARSLFEQADKEAVEGTNNGSLSWLEAHENWTRTTRETLSPAAFAKRIMAVGGGKNTRPPPKPSESLRDPSVVGQARQNGTSTSSSRGTSRVADETLPDPISEFAPAANSSSVSYQALTKQRSDINRIESKLDALQNSVNSLSQAIVALSRRQANESLELLTETVTNLSSKVSDIDGIRLSMATVKRRLRRLEDNAQIPSTPSSAHMPPSIHPALRDDELTQHSPKRRRLSDSLTNGQNYPGVDPLSNPMVLSLSKPPANTQAAASQESWQAPPNWKEAPAPVQRAVRRGRPPKYRLDDPNATPPWERDSWQGSGHESAHSNHAGQSGDRGRVVRRGRGGGFVNVSDSGRKTRQKPVRNAQGVLIRKDGRPDQRSYTSAANIKKAWNNRNPRLDGQISSPSPQASTPVAERDPNIPRPPQIAPDSKKHDNIMKQMFPNGVTDDARRLNHAQNLFSASRSPEKERMLPRKDMQREELADNRKRDDKPERRPSTISSGGEDRASTASMARTKRIVDLTADLAIPKPAAAESTTISSTAPASAADTARDGARNGVGVGVGVFEIPETPVEPNSLYGTTEGSEADVDGDADATSRSSKPLTPAVEEAPPTSTRKRAPSESEESYRPAADTQPGASETESDDVLMASA